MDINTSIPAYEKPKMEVIKMELEGMLLQGSIVVSGGVVVEQDGKTEDASEGFWD